MLLRGCDRRPQQTSGCDPNRLVGVTIPNRLVGVTPTVHADHVSAGEVVSEVGLGAGEAVDAHAGGGDALGVQDVAQVCVGANRWTRCQNENTHTNTNKKAKKKIKEQKN